MDTASQELPFILGALVGAGDSIGALVPILGSLVFGILVVSGAFFAGRFLGPRNLVGVKVMPYECGIPAQGDARDRVSVKYYLVAILFLLFDLEVAFLLPVALVWKQMVLLGPMVFIWIGFFLVFFVLGLWYEFKVKALEWER